MKIEPTPMGTFVMPGKPPPLGEFVCCLTEP